MIPFNKPHLTGNELSYIAQAHARGQLAGDGAFTRQCSDWIEQASGAKRVLLTHSCTAALEMTAMLVDIAPGDEVIMPSYTFVSTANAFVLRGATPVFVDIRPDTLNIDESRIEQAITPRTRAIVAVHYAGVACEMDVIMGIAKRHGLVVIEDAAQGVMSTYKGRALGSIGELGAYSFHETKNVTSGEGGALLINDASLIARAEIIREKGTNRSAFFRGQSDKYTWVDIGSSYLPGEITAAFLLAQLQQAQPMTQRRLKIWHRYHEAFQGLEASGRMRRPIVPDGVEHNAHMYYLLTRDAQDRNSFIDFMREKGVACVFHYVPLHTSPAGLARGRACGDLAVTDRVANSLVRLPLWQGLEPLQQQVVDAVLAYCKARP